VSTVGRGIDPASSLNLALSAVAHSLAAFAMRRGIAPAADKHK